MTSTGDGSAHELLQRLIELQQTYHHIPWTEIERLSRQLSLSQSHIVGVIEFYSFLHTTHQGEYEIFISDNITDQMQGSRLLAELLAKGLGIEIGTTRADKRVSLNYTSCIGMGDQGPAALINGYTLTALTTERINQIIQRVDASTPLDQWPRSLFEVSSKTRRKDIILNSEYIPGAAIAAGLKNGPTSLLNQLEQSGLRGCGGAGFSTASKWRFCAAADAEKRFVVCNADEGEPGTFKDRYLLQAHTDRLIEGMTLCAAVIGSSTGFIYLRGEYRYLLQPLNEILEQRRKAGLLGQSILGQANFNFDIKIHLGAGAYICGEESALIESLEGKRGIPRSRPPFPVTQGYCGFPTVVNNVETFCNAAMIAQRGPEWFRQVGTPASPGTKLLSISGDCERPGIYEFPFGTSIRDILHACGAQQTLAVQIGGAAGRMIPATEFNRTIAFEDISTGGSFMIFNQNRELLRAIENFTHFFRHESCGFCTPCRVGSSLLAKQLSKVMVGHATAKDLDEMSILGSLMQKTSHCGLGQTAANPILDGLGKFPSLFQSRLRATSFEPAFDLDASLEEARLLTGRDDPDAHLEGGGV
ncbi:MAG: NADP oxidoreductase [Sedimenticola selenatireducens]|uniref:NADH-quinone oxidoreductase subunit F n=2 Tax=Sedimenticola selenatireducens TaxID=191960 RepID=A0A558DXX7_9GAMM|nr:NADP oxidoreductase [Sedimenticola selenatireducens]TVT65857.1 MAG: NADP oxidoreductase [Sedimenticola selenatireducens]